jgi:hypothetical protein
MTDGENTMVDPQVFVRENAVLQSRCSMLEREYNIVAATLAFLDLKFGFDAETVLAAINQVSDDVGCDPLDVKDLFFALEFGPEDAWLKKWDVTVTVPMYFTMEVEANTEDDAREKAYDMIGDMWPSEIIDNYSWDLDSYGASVDSVEEGRGE